jgi:heme/copper-type cytochrome/quinol oxidase subunit 2
MSISPSKLCVLAVTLTAGLCIAVFASRYYSGSRGNRLLIVAVAHEWWWDFNYPSLGVVHARELHLPVGVPIRVQLASADTFHSFWLPGLKHSVQIAPDRSSQLDLTVDSTGHVFGNCDAGCGCGSVCMRFPVFADDRDRFGQWVIASRTRKSRDLQPSRDSAPPCSLGGSDQNKPTMAAKRLAQLLADHIPAAKPFPPQDTSMHGPIASTEKDVPAAR